jgi:hypothetical protein
VSILETAFPLEEIKETLTPVASVSLWIAENNSSSNSSNPRPSLFNEPETRLDPKTAFSEVAESPAMQVIRVTCIWRSIRLRSSENSGSTVKSNGFMMHIGTINVLKA